MTPGEEMVVLARETLAEPRRVAARLAAMDLPAQAAWLALALVAVLWVLLDLALGSGIDGETPPWPGAELMADPVTAVPLNALSSLLVTVSVMLCGRMFGTMPRFRPTLIAVLWLQFLLLAAMGASMVVALAVPVAGGLLGIVALAIYLWFLVLFAAVLGAIGNTALAFLGLVLAGLAVSLGFGIALSLLIGLGLVSIPGVG